MQTFLPYPDFDASAVVLDDKRLGKQRVETLQILNALAGLSGGWLNHPAVQMWRGYEASLAHYGLAMTRAWVQRGFQDTVHAKLLLLLQRLPPGPPPPWLGDDRLHRSHQSSLVRKDPGHYRRFFPDVAADLPYFWPDGRTVNEEALMPEGHTLHRIATEQTRTLVGRPVAVTSPQGRFVGAETLDGAVLQGIEAWGKHLLYAFPAERFVHVHLGLAGKFLHASGPVQPALPQVRLRLVGQADVYDLVAPRVCRLIDGQDRQRVLAALGPDPLRPDADPEVVWRNLQRKRQPIGAVLLDQAVLAGVGNALRAEVLFLAGIHPQRLAKSLSREEFAGLWHIVVARLQQAVRDGRILSVVPDGVDRETVPEEQTRWVYRQPQCRRCGTPVQTWELAGRTAFACPVCQA
jgi:endonuclease-8